MTTTKTTKTTTRLETIPLAKLKPAEENREIGDVDELAQSIKESGIQQPIVAVQQNGHFLIVAGARRAAAAKKAGLTEVEVIVREYTDPDRLVAMAIENLQRKDLTPLEEAQVYARLGEQGFTQRQLAAKVGKSQGHISKRLSLLELPDTVRGQVDSGGITIADAVELTRLNGDLAAIERVLGRDQWKTLEVAIERELDDKKRRDEIEARAVKAEKQGHTVVRQLIDGYYTKLPKGVYRLHKGATYGSDVLGLDAKKHAELDCHAIAIDTKTDEHIPCCTNRKNHPGVKTPDERNRQQQQGSHQTYEQQEKARAERLARVAPLVEARHEFVADLLSRKEPLGKNDGLQFVLMHALEAVCDNLRRESVTAFQKLAGATDDREADLRRWVAKGPTELARVALIATMLELDYRQASAHRVGYYERWDADDVKYFEFLQQHGYEISDAEREFLPKVDAEPEAVAA